MEFGFPDIYGEFSRIFDASGELAITLSKMFVQVYAFSTCLKIIEYKILAISCKRYVK